ncbi:hypothetical protein BJX68DRAFT_272521 [Aspergillus pseudodeflectus]|uniref:Uncharacterized protein n=1 Tax=Aspergillus pseudodeflectus TaxID=176178 RepID=A0ABR4JFS7_9EURO
MRSSLLWTALAAVTVIATAEAETAFSEPDKVPPSSTFVEGNSTTVTISANPSSTLSPSAAPSALAIPTVIPPQIHPHPPGTWPDVSGPTVTTTGSLNPSVSVIPGPVPPPVFTHPSDDSPHVIPSSLGSGTTVNTGKDGQSSLVPPAASSSTVIFGDTLTHSSGESSPGAVYTSGVYTSETRTFPSTTVDTSVASSGTSGSSSSETETFSSTSDGTAVTSTGTSSSFAIDTSETRTFPSITHSTGVIPSGTSTPTFTETPTASSNLAGSSTVLASETRTFPTTSPVSSVAPSGTASTGVSVGTGSSSVISVSETRTFPSSSGTTVAQSSGASSTGTASSGIATSHVPSSVVTSTVLSSSSLSSNEVSSGTLSGPSTEPVSGPSTSATQSSATTSDSETSSSIPASSNGSSSDVGSSTGSDASITSGGTTSTTSSDSIGVTPTASTTDATGATDTLSTTEPVSETDTTGGPITGWLIPKPEVTNSLHGISDTFVHNLPTFSSWEIDPKPPLQTQIIDDIKGSKRQIENLIDKLGGSVKGRGCKSKKRSLFDSVFNTVKNAMDTVTDVIDNLLCMADKFEDLIEAVGKNKINLAKDTINILIDPKPKDQGSDDNNDDNDDDDDDDDNDTESSSSTSTTSTTSTCSETAAEQVTILCEPTLITSADSTISTTTCSPTITVTTTGCSVTDTTTTITETPTPESRPLCSVKKCGDACPRGHEGWGPGVALACSQIPTLTVSELPAVTHHSLATGDDGGLREESVNEESLIKRAPPSLIPPIIQDDPPNAEAHLTPLIQSLDRTANWWVPYRDVMTLWAPLPPNAQQYTVWGIKPLSGCTTILVISKTGLYAAHLSEDPVFKQTYRTIETQTWGLLSHGGAPGVIPFTDLASRAGQSRPLDEENKPIVIVITPFKERKTRWGPRTLKYGAAKLLGRKYAKSIYGDGADRDPDSTDPLVVPYQVSEEGQEIGDTTPRSKVIVELNPVNKVYHLSNRQLRREEYHAVGRWRVWVDGKAVMDQDWMYGPFLTPPTRPAGPVRRDDVCLLPTLASTSSAVSTSPSTLVTTTRPHTPSSSESPASTTSTDTSSSSSSTTSSVSSTSTSSVTQTHNPPGQPPGFTLPTAHPTTTRGHNPPGQPPGFTLPTAQPASSVPVSEQVCDYWDTTTSDNHPIMNHAAVMQLGKKCNWDTNTPRDKPMGRGDGELIWRVTNPARDTDYYASIKWKNGCEGPAMNVRNPTPELTCERIIINNLEKCQNKHGYRGYIEVGCLVYISEMTSSLPATHYGSAGGTTGDTGEDVSEETDHHPIPAGGWPPNKGN